MSTTRTYLDDAVDLAVTQTTRCLGCAAEVIDGPCGCGTAYAGTGQRVDYDAWCAQVDRLCSEPLFDRWAEGSPMFAIHSYFTTEDLLSLLRGITERSRQ